MKKNLLTVAAKLQGLYSLETAKGAQRQAILEFVMPEIKAIDADRKNNREMAEDLYKGIGNAIDAASVVGPILPTCGEKDATARKRAERCRKWHVARLTAVYPHFDFLSEKDGNDWTVKAIFIGDKIVREAKDLAASLTYAHKLGIKLSDTAEDIEKAIRAARVDVALPVQVIEDQGTLDAMAAIAARIAGVTARSLEQEKVA